MPFGWQLFFFYSYLPIMKKPFLFFLIFCSLSIAALAQYELDSAWFRANYKKIERMIPMRDGTNLFTAIYVPNDQSEQHPFLMVRTPYSCAPYGEQQYRPIWSNYQRQYLRENYIMVYQDVRGRYMSEGEFVNIRPFNPSKKGTEFDDCHS